MRFGVAAILILPCVLLAGQETRVAGRPAGVTARQVRELLDEGRYGDAEAAARSLLAGVEADGGASTLAAAEAIDLLVETFGRAAKGSQPEVRDLGRRAISIKEKLLGPDHAEVAISLDNLGAVLRLAGDYAGAKAAYERSLKIRETLFGAEDLRVADSISGLAGAMQDSGDLAGALPLYRRALAVRKKSLPADHPVVAQSLSNLGIALRNDGDYAGAITAQLAALAIREKALPPDHPDTSLTLGNLGALYHLTGDFTGAREMYERVLPMRVKAFGPVSPRVAETLTNMADLARDIGDYEEARSLYDRAMSMWNATMGPHHPYTALACEGLGRLLRAEGDLAGAETMFRQALETWSKATAPDHPLVAINLQNVADLLRRKGSFSEALPLYERALAIREHAAAPNQPEIAVSLAGLADLLRDMGDYAAARPLYERSLEITKRALGPRHPRVAESLNELAKIAWAAGDTDLALQRSMEAESIFREHLKITARSLSEREALRYEAVRTSGLDVALSILASPAGRLAQAGAALQVWDEVARSRAAVLDEMAIRHRTVFELEGPQLAPLVKDLEAARDAYARLAVRGQPGEHPESYRASLERARLEMERAERVLGERSVLYRGSARKSRMGVAELCAALPEATALAAYVQYRHYEPIDKGGARVLAEPVDSYLALVRGAAGSVSVVPLGAAGRIDGLIRQWREAAGSPPLDSTAASRYLESGTALRRAIWDPMAGSLAGSRRLFVVPDSALHAVSLATLPTQPDRYLIETGPMIHYLSAERDLVRPAIGFTGKGLLVLGGPDYDLGTGSAAAAGVSDRSRTPACSDMRSMTFASLPSARYEADEVEALWLKMGRPVLKLTGREAGETAFKKNAAGRDVLHLATHAFFMNGSCAPLQLSGLALAGANLRHDLPPGAVDDEDGVLTAEEIASLDLRGVGWAVLSACETGIGPTQAGEGVLGLRRAFEVAGAGTLILSLWSVSDHEVRDWIRVLYEGRLAGMSSAEAVRNASLKMIEGRRRARVTTHPFFWGAFVATGDWR